MHKKKESPKNDLVERLIIYLKRTGVKAGDKLPSERELCAMWGVNRSTLRSALNVVRERGLICSYPGMGYFVRTPKFERNLQDLRPLVELAAEQHKQLDTVVLRQGIVKSDESTAQKLSISTGSPVFELIRLRYIDGVPSIIEYSYINMELLAGIENEDFSANSLYRVLGDKYKLKPVGGRQNISITYLNHNEGVLFQLPEGTPTLFISGVTYASTDSDCPPFESFRSIIRDDQVRFSSRLTMNKKEEQQS